MVYSKKKYVHIRAISYGAYSDRDIKIGHSKSFQKFFFVSKTYGQVYQIIYPLEWHDKFKTLCLYFCKTYKLQTWRSGDLSWGFHTYLVTWLCDNVMFCYVRKILVIYQLKHQTEGDVIPPTKHNPWSGSHMYLYSHMGVSVYWPLKVLCVSSFVCDIKSVLPNNNVMH